MGAFAERPPAGAESIHTSNRQAPDQLADEPTSHRIPLLVGAFFAAALVLHASNYLYFFVDDEAIPYVYAQNVLNGKGLVYNSFEGRVEGYSDFLHVCVATVILGVVRLLHLSKLAVFAIGTFGSLVCGVGTVLITFLALRIHPRINALGAAAGLTFLSLAGPMAVWSCSSLEQATFTFLIALLMYGLLKHACGGPLRWWTTVCASAALLTRIDGFVYVGALLLSMFVVTGSEARKQIVRRVVIPAAALFVAYQIWRVLYFHEIFSSPLYAKILYKLRPHGTLLTKAPESNYVRRFFSLYGAIPLAAVCTGWLLAHRHRVALASLLSVSMLVGYLAIIGDWMFGFRFFMPVFPPLTVLIALSVSAIAIRTRATGWVAVTGCILWFGIVASRFNGMYQMSEGHESWLLHPSLDPHRHFSRYYSLYSQSARYIHPGERTAYNQAGFLTFMLDLDNIDDLGICSRFYAELPTTDVFFTEVGRYEPLTDKPVYRAGEAYLLYRDPKFLLVPEDLLRKANANRIPDEVLGGFYRVLFRDAARQNVAYIRTERSVLEFKTQPTRFLENVAHVSHLKRASINRVTIPPDRFQPTFPWLRDEGQRFTVWNGYRIDVMFAAKDEPVYEIHVDQVEANRPLRVVLTLLSCAGRVSYQQAIPLDTNRSRDFHDYLQKPIGACRMSLGVEAEGAQQAQFEIDDLRIQAQPRALAGYIERNLTFPAPENSRSGEPH